jgi:uncharacterized YigZ family protein
LFFIDNIYNSEIEVKKSKFLSFLLPYSKFKDTLSTLQKDHPKATHIVWAYRYLNEYNQVVENSTDDGEPKGVAGKPTLKVLQGKEIINSAIITVRYFGGTKLGMGGMVRGYSDSANEVLKNIELLEYIDLQSKKINVEYSNLSQFEYLASREDIKIINKEFLSDVLVTIEAKEESIENFEQEWSKILWKKN